MLKAGEIDQEKSEAVAEELRQLRSKLMLMQEMEDDEPQIRSNTPQLREIAGAEDHEKRETSIILKVLRGKK